MAFESQISLLLSNCQLKSLLIILNSPISSAVFHGSRFCTVLMSEQTNFRLEVYLNPTFNEITLLLGECVKLWNETARAGYRISQPLQAHPAPVSKHQMMTENAITQ